MSLVVISTKTNPTSLPFSLRTEGGPVLYWISASIEIGTCAPVGVGTSTRVSASWSSRKSRALSGQHALRARFPRRPRRAQAGARSHAHRRAGPDLDAGRHHL